MGDAVLGFMSVGRALNVTTIAEQGTFPRWLVAHTAPAGIRAAADRLSKNGPARQRLDQTGPTARSIGLCPLSPRSPTVRAALWFHTRSRNPPACTRFMRVRVHSQAPMPSLGGTRTGPASPSTRHRLSPPRAVTLGQVLNVAQAHPSPWSTGFSCRPLSDRGARDCPGRREARRVQGAPPGRPRLVGLQEHRPQEPERRGPVRNNARDAFGSAKLPVQALHPLGGPEPRPHARGVLQDGQRLFQSGVLDRPRLRRRRHEGAVPPRCQRVRRLAVRVCQPPAAPGPTPPAALCTPPSRCSARSDYATAAGWPPQRAGHSLPPAAPGGRTPRG